MKPAFPLLYPTPQPGAPYPRQIGTQSCYNPTTSTALSQPWQSSEKTGADMNEEQFNLDLRKFLKRFGISAQRAIEEAVRKGLADGSLSGAETIKARARLEIEGREVDLAIEEDIRLS